MSAAVADQVVPGTSSFVAELGEHVAVLPTNGEQKDFSKPVLCVISFIPADAQPVGDEVFES